MRTNPVIVCLVAIAALISVQGVSAQNQRALPPLPPRQRMRLRL
jgi:hypothetical protein